MSPLHVIDLRTIAREAMLGSGARGFMRFAAEGDALLVTDAAVRCADGGAALEEALAAAGFACRRAGNLLHIAPGDALLMRLCARTEDVPAIDWDSPMHPAQAFAARLMREGDLPMTQAGRAFVIETARLCWQPEEKLLAGLASLRALAAQCLRSGERSGFAPAGRLLINHLTRTKEDAI